MSNLPPWIITKSHIDLTLIQQEKHNQQPHLPKTDSKNLETNIQTNINNYKNIWLPNNSIYSAELQAIKMALDMIKNSEMAKSI